MSKVGISKKWFLLLGLMLIMIGCRSNSKKTENEPVTISSSAPSTNNLDGWGADPRDIIAGKDVSGQIEGWYTKKYSGKPTERSVELKSPSYMESSCKQSIKKENGKNLIESAYNSLSSEVKSESITELNSKIGSEDLKKLEVFGCKPTGSENSFSECECYLSFKVEGGKKAIIEKLTSK